MIASIDLRGVRQRSSDYLALRAYLQQLVGQRFLDFRFSYGDELTLHCGRARKYVSPKLGHLTKGSYVIGARASSWFLTTHSPPVVITGSESRLRASKHVKPFTKEQLEASDFICRGTRIMAVDTMTLESKNSPYGFGLSILFDDGSSFLIIPGPPNKRSPQSEQIADWEVFTPYGRYLRVGPGRRWSYLASRKSSKPAA